MIGLPRIAMASLAARRGTAVLVVAAIALAVALLLAVERVREAARESFAAPVTGTDLVVGARSSALPLLLHAFWSLGDPPAEMSFAALQSIRAHPAVAWAVPIALGDSYRGYRVVGTDVAFFEHFRHGDDRALAMQAGRWNRELFDAVLGAEVAARLSHEAGDRIALSHGTTVDGAGHDELPFTVAGVLAPTGTPVDRSVFVSLEAIEAIHLGWQGGRPMPGLSIPAEFVRKFDLAPKRVTAALVGLKRRSDAFAMQRHIESRRDEPLTAALPGIALDELWRLLEGVERLLRAVAVLVAALGIAMLVAVMLAGLAARRRELALLRAVGARPVHLFALLAIESVALALLGCVAGVLLLTLAIPLAAPKLAEFGILLAQRAPGAAEWAVLAAVPAAAAVASLIPGVSAYRRALADGLAPTA